MLDAPPTGRIGRFLNVTAETARLAKMGPIKTQSDSVAALLRSPITAVHVVTLLEEMPVQETIDAIAELEKLRIPVGNIVVNGARPPLLTAGKVTQAELKRGLAAAGLATDRATVAGLYAEAQAHLTRRELGTNTRPAPWSSSAWAAATATLLNRQKPIARELSAWWPGGRRPQKATRSPSDSIASTAPTAPPAACSAAS